jgi:ankyrin repeat protein
MLLAAYPEALREKDNAGNLPLHHLIETMVTEKWLESSHPATDGDDDKYFHVRLAHAFEYTIEFDERSSFPRWSGVTFFKDSSLKETFGDAMYNGETLELPGINGIEPLVIPSGSFVLRYTSRPLPITERFTGSAKVCIRSPGESFLIIIESAFYYTVDVTQILQKMLTDQGGRELSFGEADADGSFSESFRTIFFGLGMDPESDIVKYLMITYGFLYGPDPAEEATPPPSWGFRIKIAVSKSLSAEGSQRADDLRLLLDTYPQGASQANAAGKTPLMLAVEGAAAESTVMSLLAADPVSASIPDEQTGALPLHAAIDGGYSNGAVRAMLEAYTDAAKAPSSTGRLPLHYTASMGDVYDIDLLERLLEIYPEGALLQDGKGQLPIHNALQSDSPESFVMALLRVNPSCASYRDSHGCLPLHCACSNSRASPGLIAALISAYSEATQEADRDGRLPLHRLLKPSFYPPDSLNKDSHVLITKWDMDISDNSAYQSKNTATKKPVAQAGNSYSSLARVRGDVCALTVELVGYTENIFPISFGLADKDRLNGSPIFGSKKESWGILQTSVDDMGIVGSAGTDLCKFRKMRVGEKFNIKYSRVEGKAWLKINDGELFQEFQIHKPGSGEAYVMGTTSRSVSNVYSACREPLHFQAKFVF